MDEEEAPVLLEQFPVLPKDTVYILDYYHLLERLKNFATTRFTSKTTADTWLARTLEKLQGKMRYRRKKQKLRKGHTKRRGARRRKAPTVHLSAHPKGAGAQLVQDLLAGDHPMDDDLKSLVNYVKENADRTDVPGYRSRGMQIGSGTMESLHRVASQMRLKVAGVRWTGEKAIAVLNLRLMLLAKRWDDFWRQADLTYVLQRSFGISQRNTT